MPLAQAPSPLATRCAKPVPVLTVNATKLKAQVVQSTSPVYRRATKMSPIDSRKKIFHSHSLKRKRPRTAGSPSGRPRHTSFSKVRSLMQQRLLELLPITLKSYPSQTTRSLR